MAGEATPGTGAPVEKAQGAESSEGVQAQSAQKATRSVAEAMGIEQDVLDQIQPKAEDGGNVQRPTSNVQRPTGETEQGEQQQDSDDGPIATEEDSEEEEESESGKQESRESEAEEGEEQQASPFKDKRVQERIGKLTRQREEAREEIQALRDELERVQQNGGQQQQNGNGVQGPPTLDNVRTERELNQVVGKAQAVLDFCDAHPDGVEAGEGDQKRFVEPTEIAKMRRDAERTLLKAEPTRTRIRDFGSQMQKWNATAKEFYPELFPTQEALKNQEASEEYYYATALVQAAPQVFGSLPEANLLLGDLAFAKKCRDNPAAAIEALQKRVGNVQRPTSNVQRSNGGRREDIPELLRKKQPPIAPAGPGRPSASAQPSTARKKQEAMSELVADPDGGAEALTKVFAAMGSSTPGRRTPVGAGA